MKHWLEATRLRDEAGMVEKHVFTKESAVAEAVLYRYPDYATRTVICCSTQAGCPMGCRFCGAGDYFVRNLTSSEIVEQVTHLLEQVEAEEGVKATSMGRLQIMFMSMGEPLLNLKHLLPALEELHERYPEAALLVSTSGPQVDFEPLFLVAEEIPTVGLQFSVHESTDEARDRLVPFKRKHPLVGMAALGEEFFKRTGRQPFFNYCVHGGNNSPEDVARLRALFKPETWQATVSVICERDESVKAAHERQQELTEAFMKLLLAEGYGVRRFDPAGQDTIGGGCGQLPHAQRWFKEHEGTKARASVGRLLPIITPDRGCPTS